MLKNKKQLIIVLSLVAVIIVLGLSANVIINPIIESKVQSKLNEFNKKGKYTLAFESTSTDVFKGRLKLNTFSATPTQKSIESLTNDSINSLSYINIPSISIAGLKLFKFLTTDKVTINTIKIDDPLIINYKNSKSKKQAAPIQKKDTINSFKIKGLKNLSLEKVILDNYTIQQVDIINKDTLLNYNGKELKLSDIKLEPIKNTNDHFYLNKNFSLDIEEQYLSFLNSDYRITVEKTNYSDHNLNITNAKYKPIDSYKSISNRYKYSVDIFDIEVNNIIIQSVNLHEIFTKGLFSVSQVDLNRLALKIYKDKSKPFDYSKNKPLPIQLLKQLEIPIDIRKTIIKDSHFDYTEQLVDNSKLVRVFAENLNTEIQNITSIKDWFSDKKPLKIQLNANLLNAIPVEVQVNMPYHSNTFTFSGKTKGTTSYTKLNPIIYPAMGMKFIDGDFNGFNFDSYGNNDTIEGEMIVYSKDLKVELFKKDGTKNGVISWLANVLIKKTNPNNKGKISIAKIDFNRAKYKGFPNYLWNGVKSGFINSIIPSTKRKRKKPKK